MVDYTEKQLRHVLNVKQAKNPRYSIRAFARDLGMSRSVLSAVLSEKRRLSPKNALKVKEKISISLESPHELMAVDHIQLLSDWYHFAILNLAKLPSNQASPKWIANRLGISARDAEAALARLKRVGYLQTRRGKLVRTAKPLRTPSDVPSSAIQSYHAQNLELAKKGMDQALEKREFLTMCLLADPAHLVEAKKRMRVFWEELSSFLESGTGKELYTFSMQLFSPRGNG